GQIPVPLRDALAGEDRGLAFLREQQALEVMELLVVEGVVRLREVDLPPRVRDLGALVGGLRGPGDVLREIEVAVGPHRGVDAPTDAGHPRAVLDFPPADEILRGEDDRRGPVAGGADVEPLDRPRHDLAVQHVVDRDLRIRKLRAWMPDRVALVLHRDAGDVLLLHAVDRVRRGPVDDHVDVRPGQARGVEGHLGRLEAHLLARLLKAATEQGHPRADHPDLPHWPTPRTATAPVADGMYRQDCATPTRTPS